MAVGRQGTHLRICRDPLVCPAHQSANVRSVGLVAPNHDILTLHPLQECPLVRSCRGAAGCQRMTGISLLLRWGPLIAPTITSLVLSLSGGRKCRPTTIEVAWWGAERERRHVLSSAKPPGHCDVTSPLSALEWTTIELVAPAVTHCGQPGSTDGATKSDYQPWGSAGDGHIACIGQTV